MKVLFRCIDRHVSALAWACFTLKSEPGVYTGKDCPQTEFKLYTTNPVTFDHFKLGELYEASFLSPMFLSSASPPTVEDAPVSQRARKVPVKTPRGRKA